VAAVRDGQSADAALAMPDTEPDRRAIRAVTLGTLRWYLRFAPGVERLLARPPGELPPALHALLVVAAHQIEHSRNPAESTVHRAVDAARALGFERAAGLVNAVLRRFVRERAVLLAEGDRELAVRTAHPRWFVDAVQAAWPARAVALLEANNAHPPMTLRVDRSRISREDFLARLAAEGLAAQRVPWCPTAVVIERPVPVSAIPGFREGLASVQDAAAQLAAPLLDAQPGMRVLDACAAPGGKTGHLLEHTPELAELVAADLDDARLALVRENLARMGRSAHCVVADLRDPAALAGQAPFDRILLDVPCSSTGVIRRHPDIKLLRRGTDIESFAALQLAMLSAAFAHLSPGGRLLYANCSVLPVEGEAVVAAFLGAQPAARIGCTPRGVELPPGIERGPGGLQLLPDTGAGTDGFYYACIESATIAAA
jgi:16S rRNA (cytosine967-C5)-methyltransferase